MISLFILGGVCGKAKPADPLLKISIKNATEILVHAEMPQPVREVSFRNIYAGAFNLGDRIHNFEAGTVADKTLPLQKVTVGEYRTDIPAQSFTYQVSVPSPRAGDVAHVTWLSGEYGCLMLADLLPSLFDKTEVHIELTLPTGWSAEFAGTTDSDGRFLVRHPEDAVFFVGRNLRRKTDVVHGQRLNVAIGGRWKISDRAILESARKVFEHYLIGIDYKLSDSPLIIIAPFSFEGNSSWKAQTRGANVVVAIDPAAQLGNWKSQLGVIFTHELLHLWVPNSLALRGDYDWFFEGFTLYEALLTALHLKLIDFREYLDTLARVYDSYLSYPNDMSLIEASERRWTSTSPLVYDKGMLVAFIYDLMVRTQSDGRTTLSDLYRELFHSPTTKSNDANEAIINLLNGSLSNKAFSKEYIESRELLDLTVTQKSGIVFDSSRTKTKVTINQDLSDTQLKILKSLGYRR